VKPRPSLIAALLVIAALSCSESAVAPPPPPEGVQAITVTPDRDTLVSINDTVHLSAIGRDYQNAVVPNATFAWASSDTTIASVGASTGIVMARKNGTATIPAATNDKVASATIVVRQRAATLEILKGQTQGATVGAALDTALTVRVRDAGGALAEGVALAFTAADSSGSANPPQPTTNAAGEASSTWTLGKTAGVQHLDVKAVEVPSVKVTIDATGYAGDPDTMFALVGVNQQEMPSHPLPAPLTVKVVDKNGNAIADVPIAFAVVMGGGLLDADTVYTDLDGTAAANWTLGPALGQQKVTATLPDSAVGAIVDLPGSPVTFTAFAVDFAVNGVVGTPVVGEEMTVIGAAFDPVPANNVVTVGGVPATVTSVTNNLTRLHAIVPSFGCAPAQSRYVVVVREGLNQYVLTPVLPAGALSLAVGQHAIISDPAGFCLQLLANSGGDEYLVGVTSTRAVNGELPFVLSGNDGVAPYVSGGAVERLNSGNTSINSSPARPLADRSIRDWETSFFASHPPRAVGSALRLATPRASAVGDMIPLRVADVSNDACNAFTTVSAKVIAQGPKITVATDATLPTDPTSVATIAGALDGFVNKFGALIYGVATTYFGAPADLDGDGRVIILFSPAVAATGLPTFTTAVDAVETSVCPASNHGEVLYVGVPAAPSASDLATLLNARLPDLSHELGHLIQLSRRITAGGFPLPSWLAEAQAMVSTELAGLAVRGDSPRQDYGASVVNADANSALFYKPLFDNLSYLYGWDGASGTIAGAPERCSVFGFSGVSTPCAGTFARGAAWSFLRFLANRATGANEAGFLAALVGNAPAGNAVSMLEQLTGSPLDELLVDWAMSLYVDGRVPSAFAPDLQLSSWNLADIFAARPASQQLTPQSFGFASFSRPGTVAGGGTAYTRIWSAGAHGPLAVRVADGTGASVGSELRPRLWIVRLQ